MSDKLKTIECQHCGRGFVLTPTYCDWLARQGTKVVLPILCPTCFMKVGPQPKQCGTVKWFAPRKHYGFIVAENGKEIFFHQRQIIEGEVNRVDEGQTVRFHVHYASKGPEALNVELVEE